MLMHMAESETDWVRRMVALEEELGEFPPGGFGGGAGRRRYRPAPYDGWRMVRVGEVMARSWRRITDGLFLPLAPVATSDCAALWCCPWPEDPRCAEPGEPL